MYSLIIGTIRVASPIFSIRGFSSPIRAFTCALVVDELLWISEKRSDRDFPSNISLSKLINRLLINRLKYFIDD